MSELWQKEFVGSDWLIRARRRRRNSSEFLRVPRDHQILEKRFPDQRSSKTFGLLILQV
jgi:hypothetical protein